MDLIERYVAEVGRHLPRQQRLDVQTELRSLLQDMVEDRAQTKVDKADEEVVTAVLLEMGPPQKVAAAYQASPQYLIGPQVFPIFKLILTIVMVVLTAVTIFAVFVSAWNSDNALIDIPTLLVRAIPDLIGGLFSAFGSITIVFAILERILPESELAEEEDEEWDPRKLPVAGNSQEMKRGELIAGIVFSIIFLMLFNGFPKWASLFLMQDEQLTVVPLFSAHFYENLLPLFNLLMLVCIGVDVYKLRFRWQTRTTMMLDIGVALFTAVVAAIFILNGPVFSIDSALLQAAEFSESSRAIFMQVFNTLENLILPIILIAELISASSKAYKLWQMPKNETPPTLAGKMG